MGFDAWLTDPAALDFTPMDGSLFADQGKMPGSVSDDFCANAPDDNRPNLGAVEYDANLGPCGSIRASAAPGPGCGAARAASARQLLGCALDPPTHLRGRLIQVASVGRVAADRSPYGTLDRPREDRNWQSSMSYRSISYWFDSLGAEPQLRAPLPGDREVDVAIVGGGFTGLWTAYYLMRADPSCRVALIERETAGFGASGRNGGWCVAMIHGLANFFERDPERGAALREAIKASVDEVGAVCKAERIEADFHKGGGIALATNARQAERLRANLKREREIGWTEEDVYWLDPEEVTARIRVSSSCGGAFNTNTAAVNPAKLARGLADAAERRGASIYEQTTALAVEPGRVRTSHGTVRAPRIVMALDAHVTRLPGCRRNLMPIYEHMIATEPLSDHTWQEVGLAKRGLFGDFSRLFTYAQRTADDRIAIGGRNFDYHYGSAIGAHFEKNPRVERLLVDSLREMLPQLGKFAITHRWGGVLGIPRDLISTLSIDEATGIAGVASYAGEGVCPSNLAGRTLCDFALGRKTPLIELPWVGHRSPQWEPEPMRWLGARASRALLVSTDRAETRDRRYPLRERLMRAWGLDT